MYLQGVESIYDIVWTDGPAGRVTYGDVFHQNEVEQSTYNFEHADVADAAAALRRSRARLPASCSTAKLALPAYEQVLKASHTFNLLDARRAISVTERQRYILRVRTLARAVAEAYLREPRGARLSAAARSQRRAATSAHERAQRDFWSRSAPRSCRRKALRALWRRRSPQASHGPGRRPASRTASSRSSPRRGGSRCSCRSASRRASPISNVKRRGPPVSAAFDAAGAPTRAALAFAASCGVDVTRSSGSTHEQGRVPVFRRHQAPARRPRRCCRADRSSALDALPIPRRMRWGAGSGAVRAAGALAGDAATARTWCRRRCSGLAAGQHDPRPSLPCAAAACVLQVAGAATSARCASAAR